MREEESRELARNEERSTRDEGWNKERERKREEGITQKCFKVL